MVCPWVPWASSQPNWAPSGEHLAEELLPRETAGEAEGRPEAEGGSLGFHSALPPTPWGSGQVFSPSGPQPSLLYYKVKRHAFSPQWDARL